MADAEVPSALLSCLETCLCGSSPSLSQLVGGSQVPVLTGLGSAGAGRQLVGLLSGPAGHPQVLHVALTQHVRFFFRLNRKISVLTF